MGMGAGVGKEFTGLAQGIGAQISQPPGVGAHTGPAAALLVHEAVMRLCRAPAGRVMLVLHLSRLVPPAPRPYHVRIARALLQDTAARHEGQVFTLANRDMVLLCTAASGHGASAVFHPASRPTLATDPTALPAILLRLLRADLKPADTLVNLWRLDDAAEDIAAYTRARLREAAAMPTAQDDLRLPHGGWRKGAGTIEDGDMAGQTGLAGALVHLLDQRMTPDLMRQQTAIAFGPDTAGGDGLGALRPIFREVAFSIAALEARLAGTGHRGDVTADPFLFRHIAGRMDASMLRNLDQGALLSIEDQGTGIALHLNVTVPVILSDLFARLAVTCTVRRLRLGVEISLLDALVDPPAFARARRVLAEHGMELVLDGVSHGAMMIARPWMLQPDLLKMDWSPRLLDLPRPDAAVLEAALAETDPARVVLQHAETEAALRWGVARGIRRFQGRHVDAMLGASRLVACEQAGGCSLRQCVERAASTGQPGRSGCRNRVLLARGTPVPVALAHRSGGQGPAAAGLAKLGA